MGVVAQWLAVLWAVAAMSTVAAAADPAQWRQDWPRTDFSKSTVALGEILSGGPPKDGIPAILEPRFSPVAEVLDLSERDPVVSLELLGEARAYPLRILVWHEIVNDRIAGRPVAVTYCPLCNAAVAFERVLDGRELHFGVSGKLHHSDMIMYDHETESWWQQYSGDAIVGTLTGSSLMHLPTRLESFGRFRERHPNGRVLVPNDAGLRPYGSNPYVGYEDSAWPLLYRGEVPEHVMPMERVIVVGARAWTVDLLRLRRRLEVDDLVIEWSSGQASALDTGQIAQGRDVGNVTVRRRGPSGLVDVAHQVTFAFVLFAFRPDATLHGLSGEVRGKP